MSSPKISLEITFKLPVEVKKKGKIFVSCCPAFDLWSQGDSKDEAEKNIKEAAGLFIVSCFERGTIDQVLKDCGFHPIHTATGNFVSGSAPLSDTPDQLMIDVPIPFNVSRSDNYTPCHA